VGFYVQFFKKEYSKLSNIDNINAVTVIK